MSPEQIFFGHPFWSWISLGAILLTGELLTGSGWLLWPAAAAALVALLSLLAIGWPVQVIAFVVLGIAATYLGRRFMRAPATGEADINDPAPRLIGQRGETVVAFTDGQGRVFVDGKEWAAELAGGGELAARRPVEVVEIVGGARLKVKAA
ncbi:MAG TPA: NfeD family protein [Caulobacteraceae bacterium]|nr:NfeD family protein [Caulobacteraceae bacterium]